MRKNKNVRVEDNIVDDDGTLSSNKRFFNFFRFQCFSLQIVFLFQLLLCGVSLSSFKLFRAFLLMSLRISAILFAKKSFCCTLKIGKLSKTFRVLFFINTAYQLNDTNSIFSLNPIPFFLSESILQCLFECKVDASDIIGSVVRRGLGHGQQGLDVVLQGQGVGVGVEPGK